MGRTNFGTRRPFPSVDAASGSIDGREGSRSEVGPSRPSMIPLVENF